MTECEIVKRIKQKEQEISSIRFSMEEKISRLENEIEILECRLQREQETEQMNYENNFKN